MMGITFARNFLDDNGDRIDRIVDYVIYAVEIVGIESVCFGFEFDGTDLPRGMSGQKNMELLRRQMLERSISVKEADAVVGKNLLRYVGERSEESP